MLSSPSIFSQSTPGLWWVNGNSDLGAPMGSCSNTEMLTILRGTEELTYQTQPLRPKREIRRALQGRAEDLTSRETQLRETGVFSERDVIAQLGAIAAAPLEECEDRIVARVTDMKRLQRIDLMEQKLKELGHGGQQGDGIEEQDTPEALIHHGQSDPTSLGQPQQQSHDEGGTQEEAQRPSDDAIIQAMFDRNQPPSNENVVSTESAAFWTMESPEQKVIAEGKWTKELKRKDTLETELTFLNSSITKVEQTMDAAHPVPVNDPLHAQLDELQRKRREVMSQLSDGDTEGGAWFQDGNGLYKWAGERGTGSSFRDTFSHPAARSRFEGNDTTHRWVLPQHQSVKGYDGPLEPDPSNEVAKALNQECSTEAAAQGLHLRVQSLSEEVACQLVASFSAPGSEEQASVVAHHISPRAKLILQGEAYTGPEGFLEYRTKLLAQASTADFRIESVQGTNSGILFPSDKSGQGVTGPAAREVEVTWQYQATPPTGGDSYQVGGCSVWQFGPDGGIMGGMSSCSGKQAEEGSGAAMFKQYAQDAQGKGRAVHVSHSQGALPKPAPLPSPERLVPGPQEKATAVDPSERYRRLLGLVEAPAEDPDVELVVVVEEAKAVEEARKHKRTDQLFPWELDPEEPPSGITQGELLAKVIAEATVQQGVYERERAAEAAVPRSQYDALTYGSVLASVKTHQGLEVTEHSQRVSALSEAIFEQSFRSSNTNAPWGSNPYTSVEPAVIALRKLSKSKQDELLARMPASYLATALKYS